LSGWVREGGPSQKLVAINSLVSTPVCTKLSRWDFNYYLESRKNMSNFGGVAGDRLGAFILHCIWIRENGVLYLICIWWLFLQQQDIYDIMRSFKTGFYYYYHYNFPLQI
jgi:hypothetical protein